MKEFYGVIKNKILAGQYTMYEILGELKLAFEKNYISLEELEELKLLAEKSIDHSYTGNKFPTNYDKDQDIVITGLDMSLVELFEMVAGLTAVQTSTQRARMATTFTARSAIADSYVRLILGGHRTFSSVHESKKQEVADKLIALGREDLIDDPAYLPNDHNTQA